MTHRMEEQELLRRIAGLPREIQPENDPWAAISARIEEPRQSDRHQRHWRGWMVQAAAASVALALILGVVFGPRLANPPPAETGQPVASDQGVAADRPHALPAALEGSEAEYRAAFREFIALGEAKPILSPQTIETIEMGWADLTAAEYELTAALAANPEDRFLRKRMLELRARQLGFLRELAALDQSNRRLTI